MRFLIILFILCSFSSTANDEYCSRSLWRYFYVDEHFYTNFYMDEVLERAAERSGLEIDLFRTFIENANEKQLKKLDEVIKSMFFSDTYLPYQARKDFQRIFNLIRGKDSFLINWIRNFDIRNVFKRKNIKSDSETLIMDFFYKRILEKSIIETLEEMKVFRGRENFKKKFLKSYFKYEKKIWTAIDLQIETIYLLFHGAAPFLPRIDFLSWTKVNKSFIEEIKKIVKTEGIEAVRPILIEKYGKVAQVDIIYNRIQRTYNSYALPIIFASLGFNFYKLYQAQLELKESTRKLMEEIDTKLIEESDRNFFSLIEQLEIKSGEKIDLYSDFLLELRVRKSTLYIAKYFSKSSSEEEGEAALEKKDFFGDKATTKEDEITILIERITSIIKKEIPSDRQLNEELIRSTVTSNYY